MCNACGKGSILDAAHKWVQTYIDYMRVLRVYPQGLESRAWTEADVLEPDEFGKLQDKTRKQKDSLWTQGKLQIVRRTCRLWEKTLMQQTILRDV